MKRYDNRKHFNRRRCLNWIGIVLLIATLWLGVGPAAAVEEGRTSQTAEFVCAFRSIGSLDPDPKTRNPDHMAQNFISPAMKANFPGLGLSYEDAKIAVDSMGNGVFYWVNARTHHMDARLSEALQGGLRQVIILGAGFDSRAYRFHDAYPEVRFFEIDLPATSMDKQRRVRTILGHKPDWVTYVSIDFNTQTLNQVLTEAGYAADRKSFFLWEGVTNYITKAGVDSTLRFVAEQSAPGSQLVFDYMREDVVLGLNYAPYGARRSTFGVATLGEPFIFGIDPLKLRNYVQGHGLTLLSNIGPSELTRRYLTRSDGSTSGKMAEFLHIAHVQVPDAARRRQLVSDAQKNAKPGASVQPTLDGHFVPVPDDVQAFFAAHTRNLKRQDFDAILAQHSHRYLAYGFDRHQSLAMLRRVFGGRPIEHYAVVLTHFKANGAQAEIDGYVQRKGFRTPLMINRIIKEADGRWRWYGNQR